jgi:hypothetical protein
VADTDRGGEEEERGDNNKTDDEGEGEEDEVWLTSFSKAMAGEGVERAGGDLRSRAGEGVDMDQVLRRRRKQSKKHQTVKLLGLASQGKERTKAGKAAPRSGPVRKQGGRRAGTRSWDCALGPTVSPLSFLQARNSLFWLLSLIPLSSLFCFRMAACLGKRVNPAFEKHTRLDRREGTKGRMGLFYEARKKETTEERK